MLKIIKDFINDRPRFVFAAIFIACVFLVLFALQGCNLASFVDVDIPPAVQVATGAPQTVTLDNVGMVWEDWKAYVTSNTSKFENSIDNANERYAVLSQVVDIGIQTAQSEAGGIPGGTILLSGLSLLTGIFLKRPGEDARVAKEKEDSYNKGLEVGSSITKT